MGCVWEGRKTVVWVQKAAHRAEEEEWYTRAGLFLLWHLRNSVIHSSYITA